MPALITYDGKTPRVAPSVFLADGSIVSGDVEIGENSSLWFGTIVRGDVDTVRIGARTNLQDQTVVHVTAGKHRTVIGDDVTAGHRAVLHGCTVNDRSLVGIGAIVMDGAVIGPEAMVGAGALVPPGMVVPPGKLVLGSPARVVRDLTPEEIAFIKRTAERYVGYAATYRRGGGR